MPPAPVAKPGRIGALSAAGEAAAQAALNRCPVRKSSVNCGVAASASAYSRAAVA